MMVVTHRSGQVGSSICNKLQCMVGVPRQDCSLKLHRQSNGGRKEGEGSERSWLCCWLALRPLEFWWCGAGASHMYDDADRDEKHSRPQCRWKWHWRLSLPDEVLVHHAEVCLVAMHCCINTDDIWCACITSDSGGSVSK